MDKTPWPRRERRRGNTGTAQERDAASQYSTSDAFNQHFWAPRFFVDLSSRFYRNRIGSLIFPPEDCAAIAALLRDMIAADRFLMSPRIKRMRAILNKLDPPVPKPTPLGSRAC